MNVMNQISQQLLQEMPKTAGAAELAASMMSSPIDAWGDADMESVIRYLRGNTKLRVPDDLRVSLGMNQWQALTNI